jgi:branched-chain amino acid transport system substrate-binding protein
MVRQFHGVLLIAILVSTLLSSCQPDVAARPIKIGLIAPISGPVATSGEAIQRGMLLAINEVNARGGVLGRPLALVTRDVPNDSQAGVAALRELVATEDIVALFGGIFSPVMMAQLDAIHELKIPLINPWGSMSAITLNGRNPNFAFRVSVSDRYADEFLARYAITIIGSERPAIMADTSSWGESNVEGLLASLNSLNVEPIAVERFAQGDHNMTSQIERLQLADADALLLIANAPEGAAIVRAMAIAGWRVPIVSHWGLSGGNFPEMAGIELAEGVLTLQTFSFYGELSAKAQQVRDLYFAQFGAARIEEITAPVGVAHGYDGVHLLALAIEQAGVTSGVALQAALEDLPPFDGIIKQYAPAFTASNHDALLVDDYMIAVWSQGRLIPADKPNLSNE